jgi:hypothetical protein
MKPNVRQKRVAHIATEAKRAFASHEIEQVAKEIEMVGIWRCGRPGEGVFGFSVTVAESSILLTGDLGVLVVQRTGNMIGWAKGAIDSIDYFAEKVPREILTREFDVECVTEWLEFERAETHDPSTELQEAWASLADVASCGEIAVMAAVHGSFVLCDGDTPDFTNWTPRFLWQREALKWWLEHLPASAD